MFFDITKDEDLKAIELDDLLISVTVLTPF